MTRNPWIPRLVVAFVALMAVVGAAAPAAVAASSPPATPHQFYGTVTDGNGDAVSGVTVTVSQSDYETTVTTGEDGSYSVNVDTAEVNTDGAVTISVEGESKEREVDAGGTTNVDFAVDGTSTPPDDGTPTPGTPTAAPGGGGNTGGNNDGSSGGGGGGAGGGSSVVSGSADVDASGAVSVDLSGGKAVESVDIQLPEGTTGDVSVDEVEDLPDGVSETRGKRMALLDVHAPDPGDGTAIVRLSVSKHVVDAYRASPEELTIEHYDGAGEWETLDTSVASTSGGKVMLEAETSGFSLYAVTDGGSETATTTAATTAESSTTPATTTAATPEESTDATTSTQTTTTRPFPGFGPAVAVVALLAVALLARRRE